MAGPEIMKLKRILREKAAGSAGSSAAPVTLEQSRKGMEKIAFKVAEDVGVEPTTVAGRPAEWLRAPGAHTERVILYLHGGGYVMGSPNTHRSLGGEVSRAAEAAVLMLDYRMGPEEPFPAAVEDGVAALQWLLDHAFTSNNLAIAGDSAGGGLTAATLVCARDKGIAMPAAAVCISPWSDLTCSNESYRTRADADPMITQTSIAKTAGLYLKGKDAKDPYASPNFATLHSLPPLLIHVGGDEVLLDDAITLDAKAKAEGVDSTLEVWEDMIHVWHAFHPMLPEGRDGIARIGEFLREKWAVV